MVLVVQTGNGDIIERMWRLIVSARKNNDTPLIWRLTEEILEAVHHFYRLGHDESDAETDHSDREPSLVPERVQRFLDVPVDPTTTQPHLLCRPNVVYHL